MPTEQQAPAREEVYAALYLVGTLPKNRNLNVGGEEFPQTTVANGMGGGLRAGVFPAFTRYALGIQAETFGQGNEVSAPQTIGPSGIRSARATLLSVNTLVSLVLRYPGEFLQPYMGIGAGWSSALLVNTDLQRGGNRFTGTPRDTTFAYQYFAGLRMNITSRVFVFSEYKFFTARYAWDVDNAGVRPSLLFHAQIIAGGVGLSF